MLHIHKEKSGEKTAVLNLEGEITIEHAEPLREALLEGLRELDHIILNCEKATDIDFFALQMICSAHRTSISWEKLLTWQGSLPPKIRQAITATGFARSHGCDLCPGGSCCLWC